MRIIKDWIANYNISKGGVLLILLILTLLPFLILSFYNHPSPGDDYMQADIVFKRGFWGAQKYWYLNFSGRWFSSVMISLTPLCFHAYWACKFNAIIFLLLLVVATYWLSGKIFKNINMPIKIGITSLFIFAFIIRLPGVGDGIFWQTMEYVTVPAEIMTLFLFGTIINYYSIHKKGYFIISCLLLIAIISSYEVNMICIDFIILIIALINIAKKRNLVFPLTLLFICIIFSLIDIIAPGNSNRAMNFFPHSHQLLFSIKESIFIGNTYLIHWLPFMLFIGLLAFDLLSKSKICNKDTDAIFVLPLGFSLLSCLLIPVVGFFVLFWAEGQYPPYRSIDVIFFYFVIGILYFSFSVIVYVKKRFPDFNLPVYIKLSIYLMFVFIVIFRRPNNISVAYTDILSGAASAYDKQLTNRYEFLTNFKGDSCTIEHIKNVPKSFVFYELPADSLCKKPAIDEDDFKTTGQYLYRVRTSFNHYYHKKYIGIK